MESVVIRSLLILAAEKDKQCWHIPIFWLPTSELFVCHGTAARPFCLNPRWILSQTGLSIPAM